MDAVSIVESEGDSEDDANDFEAVFVGGGVTDFVTVLVGGGVLDGVSENEFSEREEVGVFWEDEGVMLCEEEKVRSLFETLSEVERVVVETFPDDESE